MHPIIEEERRWDEVVASALSPEAELVSVSRWLPDSRAYARDDQLAIIRLEGTTLSSLRHAFAVLEHLSQPAMFREGAGWQALILPRHEGKTLEALIPRMSRGDRLRVLSRVAQETRRLHGLGVAHCDLREDNVVVLSDGSVSLIDFDRAKVLGPRRAALADWLGFGGSDLSPNPFWKLTLLTLEPRLRSAARRVRAALSRPRTAEPLPADPQLRLLETAWRIARASNSNAPGQDIAYYALTYRGRHFPGERAWYERWEPIRRHVSFAGKAVVELGCNMGLFSSFAMIHGARAALGVDHATDALRAASLLADAFESGAQFEQIDLGADADWERRLQGGDIVIAMSLVRWLSSPDRVLAFLGSHREVIYEGHDPFEIEARRLRSVGFVDVDVICSTDRGRQIIHARHG